jgi:hypothetical protein
MKPELPGARLHRLLLRWAPPTTVHEILEPVIADLQYEAERAATARERGHIVVRGHVAVLHALVSSIETTGVLRAALALSVLSAVGALLVTRSLAGHVDGRVRNSAFLAPVMLAPLVLRLQGTTSARRLFVGSLLVSILTPVLAGATTDAGYAAWTVVERALGLLIVFAPTAAAAAIIVAPNHRTLPGRAVTAVSLGSGVATTAFLGGRWLDGQRLSIGLAMTPFYLALFGVLFGLTVLPALLVLRRFLWQPIVLAGAGFIASPAPLIAATYIDHGTLATCLETLRHAPLSFAASSLPVVAGAVVIGWRLPPRRHGPRPLVRS